MLGQTLSFLLNFYRPQGTNAVPTRPCDKYGQSHSPSYMLFERWYAHGIKYMQQEVASLAYLDNTRVAAPLSSKTLLTVPLLLQ